MVEWGCGDGRGGILGEEGCRYAWISIITRAERGHRAVGPGVVDAFYSGYQTIDRAEYDFVCKLDLDLLLPPRYFEILVQRMNSDSRIATCSGKSYIHEKSRLVYERHGDDTSLGMTKFYRMDRFEAIGGFGRGGMWDGIDCHFCRMHGLIAFTWDDPHPPLLPLLPLGSHPQT